MAKIKKRRLRWKASPSPQVVGYKLYWSENGGVDYNSDCVKLGNVTEILLPDEVKALAEINGPVELGIAAIDEVGNESDLVTLNTPYQFTVPIAPSDLWLETHKMPAEGTGARHRADGASAPAADGFAPDRLEEGREHIARENRNPSMRAYEDAENPVELRSGMLSRESQRFFMQSR